jgi:Tfp pilus assembly protein PilW
MKSRGISLVEALVGTLIASLVLAVVMWTFESGYDSFNTATNQNLAYSRARFAADTISDHLRNAQLNTSGTGVGNSALGAATPTSVTYYTDSAGNSVTYHFANGALERVADSVTATVVPNLSGLSLQYFVSNTYNGTVTATAGATPTNYELTLMSVVAITATVTTDGYTASYTTSVKLRNSPKKARLNGG